MGWIWVIFLVFSVLGNLLEKLAAEQKKIRPAQGTEEKDLIDADEIEWESPHSLPKDWPVSPPERGEVVTTINFPGSSEERGTLVTAEEWEQLFSTEYGTEDKPETSFFDEEGLENRGDYEQEELSEHPIQFAFVLAQVISRPDFRTIPWRRRL